CHLPTFDLYVKLPFSLNARKIIRLQSNRPRGAICCIRHGVFLLLNAMALLCCQKRKRLFGLLLFKCSTGLTECLRARVEGTVGPDNIFWFHPNLHQLDIERSCVGRLLRAETVITTTIVGGT